MYLVAVTYVDRFSNDAYFRAACAVSEPRSLEPAKRDARR
jgi:hypothetical protein